MPGRLSLTGEMVIALRLPPTAAVTFALPDSSPATQRADPAATLAAAWARHHPTVTDCARHHQHDPRAANQRTARQPVYLVAVRATHDSERELEVGQS
jgi:hypothetical protein